MGERSIGDGLDVLEPLARPSLGLEGAGVVDRQGGAVGGELQELDLVFRECPIVKRADVQHADCLAADQQRHAKERLDALLAEDRIEHLCVIDVVEHDGSALGSHAAREAAAERDTDAALHLLLDPDGRTGDEFVRLRVDQQHRACIHVEELARPQEERGKQLFEFEMRKRGIRQCLEPAKTLRVLMPRHDRSVTIASPLRRVAHGLTAHAAHVASPPFVFPCPSPNRRHPEPANESRGRAKANALRKTTLPQVGQSRSLRRDHRRSSIAVRTGSRARTSAPISHALRSVVKWAV